MEDFFEKKFCTNGCCHYITSQFTLPRKTKKTSPKKAGAFIYDYKERLILLVQSRGNMWGMPKGTFERNETSHDCTIREVAEETGITIPESFFENLDKKSILNVYSNGYYYFYPVNKNTMEEITIPKNIVDNDVNAIGWFKVKCMIDMYRLGDITINNHTARCMKFFLGIDLLSYK